MNEKLVPMLKPLVTTFSEGIKYNCKHGDELCVGGRIERIFNFARLTQDPESWVYVTVDDGVGETSLMIPGKVYDQLEDKYDLKENMVVLAKGKLLDPNKELAKSQDPARVVCWVVEPIGKDE